MPIWKEHKAKSPVKKFREKLDVYKLIRQSDDLSDIAELTALVHAMNNFHLNEGNLY